MLIKTYSDFLRLHANFRFENKRNRLFGAFVRLDGS